MKKPKNKDSKNLEFIKKEKEFKGKMNKQIQSNILIAIALMIYFLILSTTYQILGQMTVLSATKILAIALLLLGIFVMERAYKKDDGKLAIHSIEVLVIAAHTLSIRYVVAKYDFSFPLYITVSSYIFAIYFVFKSIIIYTKQRKEYLESFSDIPEITKKEEPIVKEAKKRNNKNEQIRNKSDNKKEHMQKEFDPSKLDDMIKEFKNGEDKLKNIKKNENKIKRRKVNENNNKNQKVNEDKTENRKANDNKVKNQKVNEDKIEKRKINEDKTKNRKVNENKVKNQEINLDKIKNQKVIESRENKNLKVVKVKKESIQNNEAKDSNSNGNSDSNKKSRVTKDSSSNTNKKARATKTKVIENEKIKDNAEQKQENDEKVRVKNELKSNSKINEKAKNKEQKNLKIKPEKRKI